MLTFKKALVVAFAILACMFFFTTFHQQSFSSLTDSATEQNVGFDTSAKGAASGSKDASPPATKHVVDDLARGGMAKQKLLTQPGKTLEERLRYQYPYDPSGKFPAYIWQTWKVSPSSGDFAMGLRSQEASWTEKHPGFVHEVITDETARRLVRYLYSSAPEVLEAYDAMPVPVLKADFFRYLILFARGGIYSDIDTEALQSASEWLPSEVAPSEVGLLVGIEADPDRPDWKDWYSRRIQFCQWTIQAKVGHPVLRNIIIGITQDTLRMKKEGILKVGRMDKSIVEFTGPAIWTDKVFDYFNDPTFFKIDSTSENITWHNFTNMKMPKKVGDVLVLPITSFSPGVGQMGAGDVTNEMAFVRHDFEGSWKHEWEHIKPVIEEEPESASAEA